MAKKKEVGAFEAKTHFSSLLEEVVQGHEVTITKHGRPIAKLVPVEKRNLTPAEAIERLKTLRKDQRLEGLDWKELRDAGRKY